MCKENLKLKDGSKRRVNLTFFKESGKYYTREEREYLKNYLCLSL